MLLTTIFYHVDNFCNDLDEKLIKKAIGSAKQPGPQGQLSESEIMTIVIFFIIHVQEHLRIIISFISKVFSEQPFQKPLVTTVL